MPHLVSIVFQDSHINFENKNIDIPWYISFQDSIINVHVSTDISTIKITDSSFSNCTNVSYRKVYIQ